MNNVFYLLVVNRGLVQSGSPLIEINNFSDSPPVISVLNHSAANVVLKSIYICLLLCSYSSGDVICVGDLLINYLLLVCGDILDWNMVVRPRLFNLRCPLPLTYNNYYFVNYIYCKTITRIFIYSN